MNGLENVLLKAMSVPEPGDYQGGDGLLYCGACQTPKQFRMGSGPWAGRILPCPCQCRAERMERDKERREAARHAEAVKQLKKQAFTGSAMREWTFAHDNGGCPQLQHARRYVERWEEMRAENIGLLLWGPVGTGKSFFAGCVANALMEREVSVRMTNFAAILSDFAACPENRGAYISSLTSPSLLILDDLGMERDTAFAMEQVYHVIDSRYRSAKPLIVTTNLTLGEIKHPPDAARGRIYDRVLAMCAPICFSGENLRAQAAKGKREQLIQMMR